MKLYSLTTFLLFFISLFGIASYTYGQKPKDHLTLLEDVNKILKDDPNNPYYLKAAGDIYFLIGNFDLALTLYNSAIDIAPLFIDTYNARGLLMLKLKRYDEALRDFNFYIQQDTMVAEVYFNKALVYDDLNEYDKALKNYDLAIVINPSYSKAYYNKAIIMMLENNLQEALRLFDSAILIDPDEPYFYINRGYLNYKIKDFENAINDLTIALQLQPSFTIAYKYMGLIFLEQGQINEACECFEKLNKTDINEIIDYINKYCK